MSDQSKHLLRGRGDWVHYYCTACEWTYVHSGPEEPSAAARKSFDRYSTIHRKGNALAMSAVIVGGLVVGGIALTIFVFFVLFNLVAIFG